MATYSVLRGDLPADAAAFWDSNAAVIERGIMHTGKFESYFRLFRRWVLPLAVPARKRAQLLEARETATRHRIYRDWNTVRWRLLFRLFFSRFVMGRLGRDPEFFRQVDGPVAERILGRTRYALTELPANTNPFLVAILTGGFSEAALPRYLRPEHFETIRSRLDRIKVRVGRIEETGAGPFAGFNLSDVFEYMPPPEHERVYRALFAQASPGARLVYWNMLAPRGVPESLRNAVTPCNAEAAVLHAKDNAWFYSRLHIDEVRRA
jgi:S-adenosylmethionine-diacylglycerol 3-amino-3-carboxypropyl transferase